jgi:predicted nucleic acid-binding protein
VTSGILPVSSLCSLKAQQLTAISPDFFRRDPLPYEAAFLAGQSFLEYRRREGERRSPLPDFYIGAHAAVAKIPLLTRDINRYRTYFPSVQLITP